MSAIFAFGLVGSSMVAISAEARSPNEIYGSVFQRYKNITDARKKLRSLEKKGQLTTGEEYYALGHACQYEESASQSMILTALSRSRCKEKSGEYFVEAGMRGVPEGFVSAAQFLGRGDQAYLYAQVAYQLSGDDASLRSEALDLLSSLSSSVSDTAVIDQQAIQLATQLATDGPYGGLRNAATTVDVQNRLPSLAWLDFKNPKRCHFSEGWQRMMQGAYRIDDRDYLTKPATTSVPDTGQRVTGRITRPQKEWESIVRVEADVKGRWNGLTVLGTFTTFVEESHGVWGDGIRFAEPVEIVAQRLAAAGFVVNRDGSERRQVDKVERSRYTDQQGKVQVAEAIDGVITSIERINGETYFFCDEIFEASYGA
uniref:hypothetical protein n=1 Tax=Parerythrobacter lutipelagi TaxID=1964208 RepID=UPI0010F79CBB|nr:hypothetical protein [Parerythrobacter lutipelagi]